MCYRLLPMENRAESEGDVEGRGVAGRKEGVLCEGAVAGIVDPEQLRTPEAEECR